MLKVEQYQQHKQHRHRVEHEEREETGPILHAASSGGLDGFVARESGDGGITGANKNVMGTGRRLIGLWGWRTSCGIPCTEGASFLSTSFLELNGNVFSIQGDCNNR